MPQGDPISPLIVLGWTAAQSFPENNDQPYDVGCTAVDRREVVALLPRPPTV